MNNQHMPEILISPLNWGLGHASRCIPLIRYLLEKGAGITVATSGRSLFLLQKEFPDIHFIDLPGFSPSYSKTGKMSLKMLILIPKFIYCLIAEKIKISRLIKLQKFDVIISDNRYGVFNRKVKSIIIIHQIRIKALSKYRWIESILLNINLLLLKPFQEIWIPDYEGAFNLAGELCHHLTLPSTAKFIGPLSRFHHKNIDQNTSHSKQHILIMLSGQEPQRTILELKIREQLKNIADDFILVQGITDREKDTKLSGNISIRTHVLSDEARKLIEQSKLVVCRPGYSTIMDLASLGAKALFIATPGQTEQEYLADYYTRSGIAYSVSQKDLNLEEDIKLAIQYPGFSSFVGSNQFEAQIQQVLNTF